MNLYWFCVGLCNNQIVTCARNMLSHLFMKGDFTHMLFIDADIVWNPDDVLKLLSHNEECVVGIYPNKTYSINSESNQLTLMPSSKYAFQMNQKVHSARLGRHRADFSDIHNGWVDYGV